jgi:hypothetical protein
MVFSYSGHPTSFTLAGTRTIFDYYTVHVTSHDASGLH